MRGTASDVFGIESDTWLRNMVRERRTVTSEIKNEGTANNCFSLTVNKFNFPPLQLNYAYN